MGFYSCTVPTFEQYTLARFIRDGYFEKHINRVRNASRKKQDKLLTAIRKSSLGPLVSISGENAGLHFLMTIDYKGTKQEFIERCAKEGIHLVGLQSYEHVPRPEHANVFVISYASIPEERFDEAAERLFRAAAAL
jgi:GntR family transcriptional regulator/MocR family aminotransferase